MARPEPAPARLVPNELGGLAPAGPGWFVVNAGDAAWFGSPEFGDACSFESRAEGARFPELGINLRVLQPGRPSCRYHGETGQEDFLVLSGACIAVVEEQELPLGPWDLLHCPTMVEHVLIGAGDGPCVVIAVGARPVAEVVRYPVSAVAARHSASVATETASPAEAYAGCERPAPIAARADALAGAPGRALPRTAAARVTAGGARPPAALAATALGGLLPQGPGWFVVNAAETRWLRLDQYGDWCTFEGGADASFTDFGINLHALQPGQPNGRYHGESGQEDFLVLAGACTLVIEEEERLLRPWDFVHCPSMIRHIFIGAGSEPCLLLMTGARPAEGGILYPVSAAAARHGASVAVETDDPDVAYADRSPRYEIPPRRDLLDGSAR